MAGIVVDREWIGALDGRYLRRVFGELTYERAVRYARAGRVEGHPVAALDVRPDLAAESESEPSSGVAGQLPRETGGDHRAHGERDGDTGEERERRRRGRGGCHAHPRGLSALGEHHP